ncbi:MAG: YcxB family protein [Oscillospiraceae bacterium]
MNGEIFFEAVCPENYEDIYRFQKFSIWHNTGVVVMLMIGLSLGVLTCIADAVLGKLDNLAGTMIIMAVMLAFPEITARTTAKKSISSPIHINNVNRYLFYQDGFVNTDNFSRAEIFYGQLVKAYETDNYFYLFVEDHRAYVINKRGFIYNTPAEMRRLLQMKLGGRFYIKSKI